MYPTTAYTPVRSNSIEQLNGDNPLTIEKASTAGPHMRPSDRRTVPRQIQDIGAFRLREGGNNSGPVTEKNAPARVHALTASQSGDAVINALDLIGQKLDQVGRALADEKNEYSPQRVAEFKAARASAIETGAPEDWANARKALYCMIGNFAPIDAEDLEQFVSKMDAGYKAGGKDYYFWRGVPGTALPMIAYLFPIISKLVDRPAAKNILAISKFPALIALIELGVYLNMRALLKVITPHDLIFRHSPNIHRHLDTPQYDELKTRLNMQIATLEKDFPGLLDSKDEEASYSYNKEKLGNAIDVNGNELKTYMNRVMLNEVYYDSLTPMAMWPTFKSWLNIGIAYLPAAHITAGIQIGATLAQLGAQYFYGSGRSKITEQYNMTNVMIFMSSDDDLHELMRSPLETRAGMLVRIIQHQIKTLEKKILPHLKLSSKEWKDFVALRDRAVNANSFTLLTAKRDKAFENLTAVDHAEAIFLEVGLQDKIQHQKHDEAHAMCRQVAATLNISEGDYESYAYLVARPNTRTPLDDAEKQRLSGLDERLMTGMGELIIAGKVGSFMQNMIAWEEIRHDPQHIKDRQLGQISVFNKDRALCAMEVTDSPNRFGSSAGPEMQIGLTEDAAVRNAMSSQVGANIAGGHWRAWAGILAGSQGSIVFSSFMGMLFAIKALSQNMQEDGSPTMERQIPLWATGLGTATVGLALLINMVAAYFLTRADPRPMTLKKAFDIASATTGSIAEGENLNEKLKVRTVMDKNAETNSKSGFVWDTVKRGATGLFILPVNAKHAYQARNAYDKLSAMQQKLLDIQVKRVDPQEHRAVENNPTNLAVDRTRLAIEGGNTGDDQNLEFRPEMQGNRTFFSALNLSGLSSIEKELNDLIAERERTVLRPRQETATAETAPETVPEIAPASVTVSSSLGGIGAERLAIEPEVTLSDRTPLKARTDADPAPVVRNSGRKSGGSRSSEEGKGKVERFSFRASMKRVLGRHLDKSATADTTTVASATTRTGVLVSDPSVGSRFGIERIKSSRFSFRPRSKTQEIKLAPLVSTTVTTEAPFEHLPELNFGGSLQ